MAAVLKAVFGRDQPLSGFPREFLSIQPDRRFWRIRFAFSSSLFLSGRKFFPARLMKNCTMFMADWSPLGETSFRAMILATSLAGLLKVPFGGNVDSVATVWDHFLLLFRRLLLGFFFVVRITGESAIAVPELAARIRCENLHAS